MFSKEHIASAKIYSLPQFITTLVNRKQIKGFKLHDFAFNFTENLFSQKLRTYFHKNFHQKCLMEL